MIKFFRKIRLDALSRKRFAKYFTYAIGEIILVVIGILIALQVSNLNEQRKDRDLGNSLKKALQSELKADIELINLDLEYVEEELKRNNSFAQRLSSTTASEDTLIQIVRHEYSNGFNGARTLDKTTFNSLESTGKMNLLGDEIVARVQKYYRDRELFIEANKNNTQIYFNLVEPFLLKYPNDTFSVTGPLQEEYWKQVDVNTLNGMFNGLLTMRLFCLDIRKKRLMISLEQTQNLIDQLD